MADRNEQILTPSQLNALARDLLEGSLPLVWVEAELSSVTRPLSGHLYFTLKDARAQIRCAMFKPKSTRLKFQPREGLRVLARGRLTLYEARGDYQLVIDHLEEAGAGALRRAFDELRARLADEGLFDAERKQALPTHVQRLAVITSPSGAAVRDVLSVLARRFPLLEVDLLPSLVQGESAAAQMTSLVQRADACGRYDVILITRGGGSLEDLWAFNDERLARAIAAAQTPVVSAVGHETDFSLSDFVADVRAPTPSVAAELLVPDQRELVARVQRAQARMVQLQQHTLASAMQRADRLALRLRAHSPQVRLQLFHRRREDAGRQLRARMTQLLERLHARMCRGHAQLQSHNPQRHLASLRKHLRALHPQAAMQRRLQHDQLRLHSIARSLEAVSPLATVARGYAIVTRPDDGSVVRSAADVVAGERLRAQLADGSIEVRVTSGES